MLIDIIIVDTFIIIGHDHHHIIASLLTQNILLTSGHATWEGYYAASEATLVGRLTGFWEGRCEACQLLAIIHIDRHYY